MSAPKNVEAGGDRVGPSDGSGLGSGVEVARLHDVGQAAAPVSTLAPRTLIVPFNWLDQDAPWSEFDNDRESLDSSEPACDHRGTLRTIIEYCECGERLLRTSFPGEQA